MKETDQAINELCHSPNPICEFELNTAGTAESIMHFTADCGFSYIPILSASKVIESKTVAQKIAISL